MTSNYVDQYGRWHIKPVTDENPLPTNNAYIYSFYAKIVGLPVPYLDSEYYWMEGNRVKEQLQWLDKLPLTRHPKKSENSVIISHDEYVGVAGSGEFYANRIIKYGENNHWQISDLPGFTPTPFRKLVINDVLSAYEELANDTENPRHAVIKYPALHPIAFWHRPEQQYFYYRCANRSPGIVRTLWFILATLISIFKKDKTSPMLGFKFLKFKAIGPTLIEKALGALFKKFGKWNETCLDYFPANHPILKKVLEIL